MVESEPDLGPRIRSLRLARGWTLEELAFRSQVSAAMLSEVERGRKNPTVRLAYQIARALDHSLTELLDESGDEAPRRIPARERRTLVDPETQVVRHGLRSLLGGRDLEWVWYELPPHSTTGEMTANRPGVEEQLTVLRGRAVFRYGAQEYALCRGDSLRYRPRAAMEYRNDTARSAEILLLVERGSGRDT